MSFVQCLLLRLVLKQGRGGPLSLRAGRACAVELIAWLAAAPAMSGVGWALFLIYRNAAERRIHRLAEHGNVRMTIGLHRTEVVVWREGSDPPAERHPPQGPRTASSDVLPDNELSIERPVRPQVRARRRKGPR